MSTRTLNPIAGNQARAPPGHEAIQALDSKVKAKQWRLRTVSGDQENAWVPNFEHAGLFPYRNSLISGEPLAPAKRESYNYRSQHSGSMLRPDTKHDRIIATTTTTQTLGKSSSYKEIERPLVPDSTPIFHTVVSAAHSASPQSFSPQSNEFAFDIDLQRNPGPQVWNHLSSSISLDIIEDYQDDGPEEPRRPPSTLPPIPDLPPPRTTADMYNPRKPQNLQELEARRMIRQVSNESAGSEDPLDPDQHVTFSPPMLRSSQRTHTTGPAFKTKASHQRNPSQSRLLPFHLNQSPFLTTDKPTAPESEEPRTSFDTVKIYWSLLVCFLFFPPLLLVLACGALDEALQVPTLPAHGKVDSFASDDRQTYHSVRRIKRLALVMGGVLWAACLVGFVLGLVL
ncbi:protein of unknown function [Taphrina deformans PYCC 5710]|uniref:Uncharacterized protein n=1 Tax=Taphrina deformans (strain PYCC 5710 / ATCC 11124 / CBS 356.35 / IMI 108563 / JCM 9778 / NBRC 8474) TaxID=1097556 RepID=R4XDQ0_TAPDE|nr:protein of unknown function [Taphrina deformans PYCC 5710]|eukprot:CCG82528.1 protein of unknown function [Taphrina deformans PYCC 5710]